MIAITGANMAIKAVIRKVYRGVLAYLSLKDLFELSVTLTDENTVRELNAAHRGIDSATDVLSFPNVEVRFPLDIKDYPLDINPASGRLMLGDIVICKTTAKAQAKDYGHLEEREYAFLALHGILHLFGFDHIGEKDEKKMLAAQRAILESLGIGR